MNYILKVCMAVFLVILWGCAGRQEKDKGAGLSGSPALSGRPSDTMVVESQRMHFRKTKGRIFLKREDVARVVGYSFLDDHDYEEDSSLKGPVLQIMPEYMPYAHKGDSHAKTVLSSSQIDTLLKMINDPHNYKNVTASCYLPRNCFCFYSPGNEIIGFYEICFECTRVESLPAFGASKKGGLSDDAAEKLEAFCKSLQMNVR